jgi:cysteinyl-tRNA synthetase
VPGSDDAPAPQDVQDLARARDEKRAEKDFAAADALREEIRERGFEIVDTPEGGVLEPLVATEHRLSPAFVESVLDAPPTVDVSVQWLVQGWPEDILRGIEAFRRLQPDGETRPSVQHVVVDCADTPRETWPGDVEVLALERDFGWGVGRNAGLRRAAGRVVVVIDGSIEPTGDILTPLTEWLADPACGIAGPFGIVTDDLREFRESDGPDVDAIEGYLMAFRRDVLGTAGFFDEKFKFYRTADIEYSFRVKDQGLAARVVPLPITRHEHRMWANTDEAERDRLSKRNFYRFLDRWRGRTDLTVAGGAE